MCLQKQPIKNDMVCDLGHVPFLVVSQEWWWCQCAGMQALRPLRCGFAFSLQTPLQTAVLKLQFSLEGTRGHTNAQGSY